MTPAGSLLVVGAHAADFVWRAAGAIAMHTSAGGKATVVALSYGERGESGDLWREPGQTVEAVKRIRQEECGRAAAAIGAELITFDLGGYPLEVPEAVVGRLADVMRDVRPDAIVTHTASDPFNPDHPVAHAATDRARKLAMGAAGVASAFRTIPPPRLYGLEPHLPEQCGFRPDTFVDYTPALDRKEAAMAAMAAQTYLRDHYRQRGEQRAVQARDLGARAAFFRAAVDPPPPSPYRPRRHPQAGGGFRMEGCDFRARERFARLYGSCSVQPAGSGGLTARSQNARSRTSTWPDVRTRSWTARSRERSRATSTSGISYDTRRRYQANAPTSANETVTNASCPSTTSSHAACSCRTARSSVNGRRPGHGTSSRS